ncbi:RNA polymerase sigma factor SigZ [Endozoicomonadaceae bacterium StTr2]
MQSHWLEHKTRLKQYISSKVNDPETANDLLQDVYLKAHTRIHQLRSEDRISAWLHRIAYNVIMDYFRSQRLVDQLPEDLEMPFSDTAELAHQELAQCLEPLMAELPEKYRQPLQLAELEGLAQQQVAVQLGLSLSGAKSRIQRGRKLLRERFTACCDIETGRGGVLDYTPKTDNCKTC